MEEELNESDEHVDDKGVQNEKRGMRSVQGWWRVGQIGSRRLQNVCSWTRVQRADWILLNYSAGSPHLLPFSHFLIPVNLQAS